MTQSAMPPAVAATQDEAAIRSIVESVATLADTGNFEALETLYSDEVQIDYSSLSGEAAGLKSAQALMTEWASVLPGFDRTRHSLSNIDVTINDSSAAATADVVADHFVDDLEWRVSGNYRYELVKTASRWQIVAMTFNLQDEQGTRDVFAPALTHAAAHPVGYLARQQTSATIRTLLESLESKDMETFATLWADDAVQDMPYSPPGHPKRVSGKPAILDLYSGWPDNAGEANFTSELVIYPMRDPDMAFAEFKGRVDVIPTKREYRQTYGALFHVIDGKIRLFREYYDPAPFAWAFGLDEEPQ